MGGAETSNASVSRFPLVGAATSDLDGLVAVVRRLTCARSLAEIMEITTQAARTLLRADGITFVMREGDFCYYAEEDALSPLWKGRRFPISLCISGWCMIEGKAAVIPDVYQDPRIPHDVYRPTFVHSLAMVPVRQEAPIAAMGAYWSATRSTSPADLELLQTIANAAALAVAFVQLQPDRDAAGAAAPAPKSNRAPEGPEIWDPQNPRTVSGKAFARGFDLAQAMVCDLDGIIRFWSGGMETLYGWSRDEAIGRRSHDLLETESAQPREQIVAELLRRGHWHGELTHRARGGRQVIVASHWALQRDAAVQPAWIIAMDYDITALKLAESELQRAKIAAEQAVRSKSQVLAEIGHDLRQPLHVIRMALSVLGPKIGAADQKTLVARADQSVDSLAATLDFLLDEAKLGYGLVEPRIKTFLIQETLDQIANQFEVLASEKGLSFRVAASPMRVRSDPRMLATILQNLVGNAVKYTMQGSVIVSCQQRDGMLSISISDTGIGIPADKIDVVFDEFRQLRPDSSEGAGLGLAIVRRTAELLGHPVMVHSTVGQGSTFTVEVPLADTAGIQEPAC